MKLKKLTAVLLAGALMITAAACGIKVPGTKNPNEPPPQAAETPSVSASSLAEQQPDCIMPEDMPAVDDTVPAPRLSLKVAALKGPSVIGMLPLVEKSTNPAFSSVTANDYEFTIAGAPDQLVGGVISGEYDIAVLPTNLAATVYNKAQGKVRLATINTLGVLYLVETGDSIKTVADLAGKTIYSSGQGSTPEYALDYILKANGITDAKVEYRAEHSEIAAMLTAGQAEVAVLPQPFVQSVLMQNDKLRVALDLTREWEAAAKDGGALAMSGIVVQQKLIDEHPEAVAAFLAEYEQSTKAVTDPAGLDDIAALAVKHEIIPKEPIAKAAIPQCNIVYLDGEDMKLAAGGFLQVLFDANPQSVGGKLPDDNFYYIH